ncbi:hypothetical protein GX865_00985 [Candidatus Saccharibacteria bacterium]|jgi:hypothetical protein|nr:hypothetical protein [Candidatus Saccharibacteria bacterium]
MAIFSRFSNSASAQKQVRGAFKEFAKSTKGAYLGEVSPHSVDQHLVRGFTASNTHKDTNHCVGHFLHHDYIALSREDGKQRYIIAEIDLHSLKPFSHFFITPNNLPEYIFKDLIDKHSHHRHTPFSAGDGYLPSFKNNYSILTRPENFTKSLNYVTFDIAKCIMEIKQPFIFEVVDTSLFIYDYSSQSVTSRLLDTQVRFACTLATLFEKQSN